jgi:hypothetical protein
MQILKVGIEKNINMGLMETETSQKWKQYLPHMTADRPSGAEMDKKSRGV